jgi:Ca-activated chloride channel family protein
MKPLIARTLPGPRSQIRLSVLSCGLEAIVILALVLFIACLAMTAAASAAEGGAEAVPVFVTPDEMKSGALLFEGTQEGRYVEAPRLGTDVNLVVSGPTIRARLTQIFRNPTGSWVEGVYVYPLPEGAAVDTMKMVIGKRVVVADIRKREEARRLYAEAKAAGRKAALLEEQRPNIFTNKVSNIGPGETVLVQIEYQEAVHQSGGEFSLRVPLVVAPRYSPAPVLVESVDLAPGGQGWGRVADPVPDRAEIAAPVLDPRRADPINPVTLSVRLQAGFELGAVQSAHHSVKVEAPAKDVRLISLAEGPVPADRDFELTWKPAAAALPSVGLFRERVAGQDYLLAFVTPPTPEQSTAAKRPREVTFVIDNSGSMGGTSMEQAKASLTSALARLKPTDRFNLIRFDDTMDIVFADSVPADEAHIATAQRFVAALEAKGGTEMVPAMRAALADPRPGDARFLRQVVFLTDGAIGNEQALFDAIVAGRGRSRIFMVGIGSAPNTDLMSRAAELGRGTFTHIGSAAEVEERMGELLEKLESPVVTNLTANLSDTGADLTPTILPDLYRGEPLLIAAKLATGEGVIEVKGMLGDRPWIVRLPVEKAAKGDGLSKLWARRKIDDAEVGLTLGALTPEAADRTILALALQHHLVTRLTSLVAVDEAPSRPRGAALSRADLPLNLPAGWDFDKVFGTGASEDHAANSHAGVRLAADGLPGVARRNAPAAPKQPATFEAVPLPQTATDAKLRLLFGLLLLTLGLVAAYATPRKLA